MKRALPLHLALQRVRAELKTAAGLSRDLQGVTGSLAARAGLRASEVRRLQSADLLSQVLDDLDTCLAALSLAAPTDATIETTRLASGLRLGDLAARLCDTDSAPAACAGELDLF